MTAVGLLAAGGRGRRMAASVDAVPKPLVTVGGMSLIERNLRAMHRAGITDVWVSVHHRAPEIEHHLRAIRSSQPPKLLMESEPLGTAGALGLVTGDADVLTVNADLLSGIDFAELLAAHRRREADLTLATHVETHRLRFGEVVADDQGQVSAYLEKPCKQYVLCSGVYVVGRRARRLVTGTAPIDLPDLVTAAIGRGLRVVEERHRAPWVDVNDGLDRAHAEDLLLRHPELRDGDAPRLEERLG